MLPVSLSEELLRQLDVLIAAVADDPVLSHGMQRERSRLASHLQTAVEPWLRTLDPRPPSAAGRCRRPSRHILSTCQRNGRARVRGYVRLRRASYLALDAELIDARIFDRLQLLGRRALQVLSPPALAAYASSSSPSAGGGSVGSGALRSGLLGISEGGGGLSPLPSRTNRSSVSTSRAWA